MAVGAAVLSLIEYAHHRINHILHILVGQLGGERKRNGSIADELSGWKLSAPEAERLGVVAMQVQRGEMDPGPDVLVLQPANEVIAGHASTIDVQQDRIEVAGVAVA